LKIGIGQISRISRTVIIGFAYGYSIEKWGGAGEESFQNQKLLLHIFNGIALNELCSPASSIYINAFMHKY